MYTMVEAAKILYKSLLWMTLIVLTPFVLYATTFGELSLYLLFIPVALAALSALTLRRFWDGLPILLVVTLLMAVPFWLQTYGGY